MSVLNREQVLARKPKVTVLELSDSGESVAVRRLNPIEFEAIRTKDPKDRNVGMQLAACICDLSGHLMFDAENAEDVNGLATRFSVEETQAIISAALKAPKKEDLIKKLEASLNTDSATD